jgi:hypothetical protein
MAAKVNLVIDQGTTFNATFNVLNTNDNPIDFTSYTITSQMRKSYLSSNAYSFTTAGSNTGSLTLSMSSNTTTAIWPGRYVYDVDVVDLFGNRSRIVEGIVTVTPEVTR